MFGNTQPVLTPQEQWRKKYPSVVTGIFSFIQFILTIVIIGCEVGSILIDAIVATVYVGFWSGLFFMIAWITQASSSCCCRNRGCATYTLIMQMISVLFAICVIGFDSYYIVNPNTCFYRSSTCSSTGYTRGLFYSTANFNNIKMPLIKAQLAAGSVMLLLCIVYILIYIITFIRVYRAKQSPTVYPQVQYPYPTLPTVSNSIITARPVNSYGQPIAVVNSNERATLLVCPTCSTAMNMTVSKRPPM